eukprot:763518-Hanusia_phi.AAC.2
MELLHLVRRLDRPLQLAAQHRRHPLPAQRRRQLLGLLPAPRVERRVHPSALDLPEPVQLCLPVAAQDHSLAPRPDRRKPQHPLARRTDRLSCGRGRGWEG